MRCVCVVFLCVFVCVRECVWYVCVCVVCECVVCLCVYVVESRGGSLLTNLTAAAILPSVRDCLWTAWH